MFYALIFQLCLLTIIPYQTEAQMFLTDELHDSYHNYKENNLTNKRFNYNELLTYLKPFGENDVFVRREIGSSLEGRKIIMLSFGKGPVDVVAWSQMHGDESTATMALIDILKFLAANDNFNDFRKLLSEKLTLHFIPMLNPDGAERFQRRNALDIDLNRDALRLEYPESKALKSVQDSLKPQFGFNLHDQDLRYTAGKTYKSATISILAPAFNKEKEINSIRSDAMKVIVNMVEELSKFIPGHIARYDDEFEPRAFGDNFAKWGTGTILIESGGWKNNFEKQFLRELNFIGLLVSFQSIAEQNYKEADLTKYNNIPENKKYLFDLLLPNLKREYNSQMYTLDIGINHSERSYNNSRDDYYKGTIDDMGDLSTFYGYEEINCEGMVVKEGKTYPDVFNDISDLENVNFLDLYEEGYTSVRVKQVEKNIDFTNYPIMVLSNETSYKSRIKLNSLADLVIYKENKVRFVVINGFIFDLLSGKNTILNGLIIR